MLRLPLLSCPTANSDSNKASCGSQSALVASAANSQDDRTRQAQRSLVRGNSGRDRLCDDFRRGKDKRLFNFTIKEDVANGF